MPERRRQHFLKSKESKDLLEKASQKLKIDLEQLFKDKANLQAIETEFTEILLIDGKPTLIKTNEKIYPTLISKELFDVMPKVVVDMGAVSHVCKGANVMAPGIRRFEGQFDKNDLVFIIDERHGKPLAIGEIAYDAEEAKTVKQGIVVKNVHYVGDRTWSLLKELVTMR
jgi:PUA domain protein